MFGRFITGPFLVIILFLILGWLFMQVATIISAGGWGILVFLFGMLIIVISVIFRRY